MRAASYRAECVPSKKKPGRAKKIPHVSKSSLGLLSFDSKNPRPRTHSVTPKTYPAILRVNCRRRRWSPESLADEFEPSAQAIRDWARQVERDEGRRHDGLTGEE